MYNLRRINEFCKEHVDNNFKPLPEKYKNDFVPIRENIVTLFEKGCVVWESGRYEDTVDLRNECEK